MGDDAGADQEALVQVPGASTTFTNCGSEATGDFDQACYDNYVASVNEAPTPVDPNPTTVPEETGSGLVTAIAAVVVISVVIGAGAVMYSKGMFGGNANKDSQAPSQTV